MERNLKIIICVLLALFTLAAGKEEKFTFSPSIYNLEIITFPKNFKDSATGDDLKFAGNVVIELDIIKNTKDNFNTTEIILDANSNTTVSKMSVLGFHDNIWENVSAKHDVKNEKLIITLEKYNPIITKYMLDIKFSNVLRNDMTGFYRSSYVDSTKNTRWLLTTHFEPIYARLVFPCFDRPDLKAVFRIKITAPKDVQTILCNTKNNGGVIIGDNKVVTCSDTLRMSTYLVAFTLSNFTGTEPEKFKSNYPNHLSAVERNITTYGRESIIKNGEGKLAQNVGKAAILALGEYLNLGYAFEKIDQIGIPDFSAGAMENWGHISFREKSLFFNEKNGSVLTKQANVLTITHELVHQWFGNLVTLESWDYIWLNEAFANYLEYVIASNFSIVASGINGKEWELMKQFVVTEMHSRAFETDGLNSSKPLNNEIKDESLILPSFNDIPYAKGASVLRMWENAVGSEKFKTSLQKYVSERALNTSNPKMLFDCFNKHANMNKELFFTWIEQKGYPVIMVNKIKDETYSLTQRHFLWEDLTSKNAWYIPISYSFEGSNKFDSTPSIFLHKDPIELKIKGKWFVINNKQYGYYRVNYNKENWNALSNVLETNHSVIDELNRAQIINDVYSLARSLQADYVDYKTALQLTLYLKKETSFHPWKTALNSFNFIQTKLRGSAVSKKFGDYLLSLIEKQFKSLKAKELSHVEKLKNIEISRWACSLGFSNCLKDAEEIFKNSVFDFPDVQEIVLCTAVKYQKAWNEVLEKYKKETDSSLKIMYISALGCTNNRTQAEELLRKTLEKDCIIRSQDLTYVLSSIYNGNPENFEVAFKFIIQNYKGIAEKYGGINPLGKAVVGIARKINSKKDYEKLVTLVNKIKNGEEGKAAKDSLENALNIAKSNFQWVEKKAEQFTAYFGAGSFMTYSVTLLLLSFATSQLWTLKLL